MAKKNPGGHVPGSGADEPLGDRGKGDKTWAPDQGEQGISNRPDDEAEPDDDEDLDEDEDDEEGDDDADADDDSEGDDDKD